MATGSDFYSEVEMDYLKKKVTGGDPGIDGGGVRTPLRMQYEAQVQVIKNQIGDLEVVRHQLGLSQRKMSQLLLVDPSAWTRWVRGTTEAPPHIWRALQWYLALKTKIPGLTQEYFLGPKQAGQMAMIEKIHLDQAHKLEQLDQVLRSQAEFIEKQRIETLRLRKSLRFFKFVGGAVVILFLSLFFVLSGAHASPQLDAQSVGTQASSQVGKRTSFSDTDHLQSVQLACAEVKKKEKDGAFLSQAFWPYDDVEKAQAIPGPKLSAQISQIFDKNFSSWVEGSCSSQLNLEFSIRALKNQKDRCRKECSTIDGLVLQEKKYLSRGFIQSCQNICELKFSKVELYMRGYQEATLSQSGCRSLQEKGLSQPAVGAKASR